MSKIGCNLSNGWALLNETVGEPHSLCDVSDSVNLDCDRGHRLEYFLRWLSLQKYKIANKNANVDSKLSYLLSSSRKQFLRMHPRLVTRFPHALFLSV
jgi:hypothetical protein